MTDHLSLFDAPRSKGAKAHARLGAQAAAAAQHVRDVGSGHMNAVREVRELEHKLTLAYGRKDEKSADEITKALRLAQARRSEPWGERLRGAELAAQQARSDADQYAAEHAAELAAELDDEVAAATARLEQALRDTITAHGDLSDLQRRFGVLSTASGRDPLAVRGPGMAVQAVVQAADAALSGGIGQPTLPPGREEAFVEVAAA